MVEPVIDLDRFADPDEEYEISGPVGWSWSEIRAIALVGVVVLALLAGGASLPAAVPFPLAMIRIGTNSGFQLAGDGLYVVAPGGDSITAYSLAGERRWTARVQPARPDAIIAAGDLVLVGETAAGPTATVALDARTGRKRWRHAGRPFVANPDHDLATVVVEQPDVGRGSLLDPPSTVIGVQLSTGRALWQYSIGSQDQVFASLLVRAPSPKSLSVRGAILFDYSLGGPVSIRIADFIDGKVTIAPYLALELSQNFVVDLGDLLVGVIPVNPPTNADGEVTGAVGDNWIVQAYRADTIQVQWEETLPAGKLAFSRCGEWICTSSAGHLQALDPATGEHAWIAPWTYAVGGQERSLAVVDNEGSSRAVGVIDPHTGLTLLNLPHWQPVRDADARWVPIVRSLGGSGRSAVAVLDRDGLRAYQMGEYSGGTNQCQANEEYLACVTGLDRIMVWHYRRDDGT